MAVLQRNATLWLIHVHVSLDITLTRTLNRNQKSMQGDGILTKVLQTSQALRKCLNFNTFSHNL